MEVVESVSDILKNSTELSDDIIYDLTSIPYGDDRNLLTVDNKQLIYDIVGVLLDPNMSPEESNKFIDDLYDTELKNVHQKDIFFDTHIFNNAKELYYKELSDSHNSIIIQEGIYTCNKCKSKRTFHIEKQTRSADEGYTVIIHCLDCGEKRTQHT